MVTWRCARRNQFDTPVLVYPVERDPDWRLGCCTDLDARTRSLTALLGHTRTAVLRNAGLVTTVRHRGSALHQVSARGTALLNQCPAVTG
jgi:hypothetical protein